MEIVLTPYEVSDKQVMVNQYELRKDLRMFIKYIQDRDVKRSHRWNHLSKTDTKRLAKSMSCGFDADAVDELGRLAWVEFIDKLAFKMGFVHYDSKGEYAGYSSTEPSYPDNYIQFKAEEYNNFISLDTSGQENFILTVMSKDYSYSDNEFFARSALSQLDEFNSSGCATHVMPLLRFDEVRSALLKVLTDCKSGVWYETASLIKFIKKTQPFFLIPEKISFKKNPSRNQDRYGNFRESQKSSYSSEIQITNQDPDAFERVEGRYVERFLEGIPLLMKYVDVAYDVKQQAIYPSLNKLCAFRVNELLHMVMHDNIPKPKVTVQPNLEIHVESIFYPASLLSRLELLTDTMIEDRVTVLKLRREKILVALTEDHGLDVVDLLTKIADQPLPQNVVTEIKEWSEQSDTFTLFEGFGILESNQKTPEADRYSVEQIAPSLRLVRDPMYVFYMLEKKEQLPFLLRHSNKAFRIPPQGVASIFAKQSKAVQSREKPKITLKWETFITLHCPEAAILEEFKNQLIAARVLFKLDTLQKTVTFAKTYESLIKKTIQTMKKDYQIRIEELDAT